MNYKNTGKEDEVYVKYDVSEDLLFNSKLSGIRNKGFNKFISKKFVKNDIDINNTYFTKISVFINSDLLIENKTGLF